MFQLPKPSAWGKLLFTGGLLLVLAQGLFELPEVESRLFPQTFWNKQISWVKTQAIQAEINLAEAEATQKVLQRYREQGLSSRAPVEKGLDQALARVQARQQHAAQVKILLDLTLQHLQRLKREAGRSRFRFRWEYVRL